jgi:hypothetical protein
MTSFEDILVKITLETHIKVSSSGLKTDLGVGSYEKICGPEFLDKIRRYRPFISLRFQTDKEFKN